MATGAPAGRIPERLGATASRKAHCCAAEPGRAGARFPDYHANSRIEIRLKILQGAEMIDRHLHAFALAAAALGAMLLTGPEASARMADFDGNWSVLVITESGTCDAAYRYGVSVENGAVRYRGESGIDVQGTVDDRGHVSVTIGRGDQRAEGTGRLTADSGTGTWSGSSTSSNCRGRWEAERR
jgi:hypothetical protein